MNFIPDPIQFYKIHVEEYFEHFSSYRYYHMRFRRQTLAISCRIVCSIQMEKSMKRFQLTSVIISRYRALGCCGVEVAVALEVAKEFWLGYENFRDLHSLKYT